MCVKRSWYVGLSIVAATGLSAAACTPRATVTNAGDIAPRPVVTVVTEPGATDVVNPPGVPSASGSLRTLHALQYVDVRIGSGDTLMPRQCVYAHYTGWLTDGTKFDSSRDTTRSGEPREPISFPQGARRVIGGWDAGFEGMREGGQRRLVIPFPLAYGEAGRPPVIPPRATLIFDVELLALRDTLPRASDEPIIPGAPAACAPWSEISASSPTGGTNAR